MPKKKKGRSLMEALFTSDIEGTRDYLLPPPFGGGAGTWKESRSKVPEPRYQKIARLQRVIDDLTALLHKMKEERDEI